MAEARDHYVEGTGLATLICCWSTTYFDFGGAGRQDSRVLCTQHLQLALLNCELV